MCTCVIAKVCTLCIEAKEDMELPGALEPVIGGCKPPIMGAGNQLWFSAEGANTHGC